MWIHRFNRVFFGCYCVTPVTLFIRFMKRVTGVAQWHPKTSLNRWLHTQKKTQKYIKGKSSLFILQKKSKYNIFISHTKSQRLLVTRQRLYCEKVNLHNTLVTWAWNVCEKAYIFANESFLIDNTFILSLRKQPTFGDATTGFLQNDIWETSAEIPFWWRVTTQIWVVLLIGRAAWEIWFNQ